MEKLEGKLGVLFKKIRGFKTVSFFYPNDGGGRPINQYANP
jgi:hypothetical protein